MTAYLDNRRFLLNTLNQLPPVRITQYTHKIPLTIPQPTTTLTNASTARTAGSTSSTAPFQHHPSRHGKPPKSYPLALPMYVILPTPFADQIPNRNHPTALTGPLPLTTPASYPPPTTCVLPTKHHTNPHHLAT